MRTLLTRLLVALGTTIIATTTVLPSAPATPAAATAPAPPGARPNIVLVLMDDFSLELLATMPEAQRMVTEGASYRNAFVVDSLCCPSRASLLTGQAPHHTGVLTNTPNDPDQPIGGYRAFVQNGNQERQFSLTLQESGYTTGFVGKFMNGYEVSIVNGRQWPRRGCPAGTSGTRSSAVATTGGATRASTSTTTATRSCRTTRSRPAPRLAR